MARNLSNGLQCGSRACTVVCMATTTNTPRHQCVGGCGISCPKRPVLRNSPNVVGERKANASAYGLSGRWATVQVLAPGNRGRNARSTAGSKRGWGGSQPKGAKRAKRQSGERMGRVPHIRTSTWDTTHARQQPTVADYLGITL